MRSVWIACILITMVCFAASGQANISRDISVKITQYSNVTIYLGNYFGIGKNFADTAYLGLKGEGHFKGKKKLTPGMYFIVSPKNKILLEFLLDSTQRFSIKADTNKLNDFSITGSPENDRFKRYVSGVTNFAQQTNVLNAQLKDAITPSDKESVQTRQVALGKKIQQYRDSSIHQAPSSLTAILINAGKPAQLPPGTLVKTHADSVEAGKYLKKHYWDDVPFNDDRLLYTSFFDAKIDNYYKNFVPPAADSVIKELQYMLLYARTGKEMYPYLLMKFNSRYFNPEYVGQNKVFLYLFNEFFMQGDTTVLNQQSKKMIFDRAYQLMANQIGDPAPPLELNRINNLPVSLYDVNSPYTMVIFWDPSCSHCQKELPRIDSMYRAKWKNMGIALFSVNINAALLGDMFKFIIDKHLDPGWIHAYQTDAAAKAIATTGGLNYFQTYDVAETPMMYLLDDKKRIIAKHLSLEQFDALMKVKAGVK